jgi:hypothetical protein
MRSALRFCLNCWNLQFTKTEIRLETLEVVPFRLTYTAPVGTGIGSELRQSDIGLLHRSLFTNDERARAVQIFSPFGIRTPSCFT